MKFRLLAVLIPTAIAASAVAQDEVSDEAMLETFATCAAVQSAVAVKMDSAMAEFIIADARWFASIVNDDALVKKQILIIQKGYNDGNISWQELVDLAQGCSTMKQELLAAQSGD
jgi:hypothetical protein